MNKTKKMSFWQTMKRFFEPIKWENLFVGKALAWFISWWVYWVFISFVAKSITEKIQENNLNWFYWDLGLFAFGVVLYHILNYLMLRWWYVDYLVKQKLNNSLLPKLFHIENTFYEKIWTGRVISIVQRWIESWANWVLELMIFLPWAFISLLMAMYVIYKINTLYLLFFLIFLLLIAFLIHIVQKKWLALRKERVEAEAEYSRNFIRNIMSKFEILQSNKIDSEINNLNQLLHWILEIDKQKHTYEHITYNIWDITINTMRWFLIFFIGIKILHWEANYSDLVLIITVIWFFDKSIQDITGIYKRIIKNFPNVSRLWEFIDESPKIDMSKSSLKFIYKSWNIKIYNITFSYDITPVFKDFNVQIQGWTKTAFVGESWGGKTTLIKLLAGYIRADSWEIEIDGQKLADIKLTDYYKHIGYLTQDPSVFDGTIYENLVYALDIEPPKEDLEKVIKLAKCEFIREFEKELETEIGERWVRLSGWQKQRLAIAKIMLKNPNIILLDEPTSALDSFNEELINIALHNLFKGKTVFIVAHRLQTVKQADRILLFEQWKILEEGTHDQLVKLNGKYKKMLDLQSGF
jgi:ATP-binding cassette subfamily B protein